MDFLLNKNKQVGHQEMEENQGMWNLRTRKSMEAYPVFLATNKLEEHLIWPLLGPVTRNSEDLQGFLTPHFAENHGILEAKKSPNPSSCEFSKYLAVGHGNRWILRSVELRTPLDALSSFAHTCSWLVVFNQAIWKISYSQIWTISPGRGENKKHLKPPAIFLFKRVVEFSTQISKAWEKRGYVAY